MRKTVIDRKLINRVKKLKEKEGLPITIISKLTEVSRPTIYKVLKNELNYVSNKLVKFN